MRTQTFRRGGNYQIRWYQADQFTWRVTMQDENGAAVDLTGLTVTLHTKISDYDASVLFSLAGTVQGAATLGIVDFAITTTHTANVRELRAEIELTASGVAESWLVFDLLILRDIG